MNITLDTNITTVLIVGIVAFALCWIFTKAGEE